jgi:hypothetical protein
MTVTVRNVIETTRAVCYSTGCVWSDSSETTEAVANAALGHAESFGHVVNVVAIRIDTASKETAPQ